MKKSESLKMKKIKSPVNEEEVYPKKKRYTVK